MNICLDACFLIGLYDKSDQHHNASRTLSAHLFDSGSGNAGVIVWPVMYETVSTRLVRDHARMQQMERDWRRLLSLKQLIFLDDQLYRDEALELCFEETRRPRGAYRKLSLTDRVLRGVLADKSVRIDGILTYNSSDFIDVCESSGRILINRV
jgi:predicted nucleic acid-binding protein